MVGLGFDSKGKMGGGASQLGTPEQQRLSKLTLQLAEELESEAYKNRDGTDVADNPLNEVVRVRTWLRAANDTVQNYLISAESNVDPFSSEIRPGSASRNHRTNQEVTERVRNMPDGTEIIVRSDGSRKQTDPEGVVIETWPDGRKVQTSPNGRCQEVHADGTKITRTPEGKVVVKRPDGSKMQTNADGTTIEITKDGTMTQYNPNTKIRIVVDPDGTQTQTNENDNSMIQVFPDGTKIDTDSSGCRIVKYIDGRKVQRNPNGTVIESWADGHKIQTKLDGSRIEVFPDGRKIQTLVDGTVVEQLKDGSQVRSQLGSFVCVQCWRCQTIMSVQRSAFVTSCRVCRNVILAHKAQVIGTSEGTNVAKTLSKTPAEVETDIRAIFDRYDSNRSQSIDKKELGQMLAELQFPFEHFDELFVNMDKNGNDQLEWEEFLAFYQEMQKRIMDGAQAPALAMTHELLMEQQRALEEEKRVMEAKLKELQGKVANGDSSASEEMEEGNHILDRLKAEYESKTAQLKQASDAKRMRQKQYLEKRRLERQKQKEQKQSEACDDIENTVSESKEL